MVPAQVRTISIALREKNLAFNNPFGATGHVVDWELIRRQVGSIDSERKEVQEGLDEQNVIKVIDGLIDMVVFIEETFHKQGWDFDSYMMKVVDSLFTRFCKDEDQLRRTEIAYAAKGVQYVVEGQFPTKCLKSAVDQWLGADGAVYTSDPGEGSTFEWPAGKFLKCVDYEQPDIRLPEPPLHLQGEQKTV